MVLWNPVKNRFKIYLDKFSLICKSFQLVYVFLIFILHLYVLSLLCWLNILCLLSLSGGYLILLNGYLITFGAMWTWSRMSRGLLSRESIKSIRLGLLHMGQSLALSDPSKWDLGCILRDRPAYWTFIGLWLGFSNVGSVIAWVSKTQCSSSASLPTHWLFHN